MNCEELDEFLLDFVEAKLDAPQADEVRSHIGACPSCRLAVRDTRELLGAIDDVKERQEQAWQNATMSGPRQPVPISFSWKRGTVLGDFEIVSEIGRGGMGVVYRARQMSLNRIVALKIMPDTLSQSPAAVVRFQKEARAAAKLHHTNIVPIYAQGEYEGHFFYAMEVIDGVSLGEILRARNRDKEGKKKKEPDGDAPSPSAHLELFTSVRGHADFRRIARLIGNVADGLDHAHKSGVLHRDVKPQNLLYGSDGELHITDFGLASLLDEPSLTVTGEMLGTPAYMSPEQVAADPHGIDHRTDVYSLGVTLYELLTGRRPFQGGTREQTIARIRTTEPTAPCRIDPAIPIDLDTICLRAMEKDPRRRYATAGEMAADLRRYAEDRPIVSRRVGWIEKGIKWMRRHPATTTIVALCVVLCAGGTVWGVRESHARHERANRLVQQAFDSLAYEDYRDTKGPQELLNQASILGPDEVNYHVAVALSQLLSDPAAAVGELNVALALRPDDREIGYLQAWAYFRDQQEKLALRHVEDLDRKGGPSTAAGHFFRAQALVRRKPEEAITSYRKAIVIRTDYYQALLHLARADNHWMYHNRRHEPFLEISRRISNAQEVRPTKAYPLYLLSIAYRLNGEIYRGEGHEDDAKAQFREALQNALQAQKVEPTSSYGYACEAEYWEAQRDYARALDARNRGEPHCRTRNEWSELYQYRWRLHYWMGHYEDARADLEKLVLQTPPTDPKRIRYSHLFPALLRAETGAVEEAASLAMEMAAASPKDNFEAVVSASFLLRMLGRREVTRQVLDAVGEIHHDAEWPVGAPQDWTHIVFEYCREHIPLDDLRSRVPDGVDQIIFAVPEFIAAGLALGQWDRTAALAHFRACEQTFDYDDYCYMAKVFTRRMELDPNWPAWLPADSGNTSTSRAGEDGASSQR